MNGWWEYGYWHFPLLEVQVGQVKATRQLTCVAKLAVFAIGAPEAGIKVENAARFCSGRVAWLQLIGWGRLAIEAVYHWHWHHVSAIVWDGQFSLVCSSLRQWMHLVVSFACRWICLWTMKGLTSWCLGVLLLNVYKLCRKIPNWALHIFMALDSNCHVSHKLVGIWVSMIVQA